MRIINVELYSIIILVILALNYILKFKKKFSKGSWVWLALTISTLLISISNIIFAVSDVFIVKQLSIIAYSLCSIISSLALYIYIKIVYIKPETDIKNEIYYSALSIIVCSIIIMAYLWFSESGYVVNSLNRIYLNKLIILAVIPNIVIFIQYIYNVIKKNLKLNYKIIVTLLISMIGMLFDVYDINLFFVSPAFTFAAVIIYLNRHEILLTTDPLTGLSNKFALETFVSNIRPNLTIAAYNFDVDKFKLINDTYGHFKGDIVLKGVAKILRDTTRDRDLVIRNGGDEFLVIAVIRQEKDAQILLERFYENLEKYNKKAAIKVKLSVGWGIYKSTSKTTVLSFEKFLKSVDKKMYEEKQKSR